jgi:hypothetical protein
MSWKEDVSCNRGFIDLVKCPLSTVEFFGEEKGEASRQSADTETREILPSQNNNERGSY